MSEQNLPAAADLESAVVDFLHENPEFFEHHLELLEELRVPHPSGGAISLIERQVERMRAQNQQIKGKLLELVENARENERINERMNGLALALMDARALEEVVITVDDIFRNDFHADAVSLLLFDGEKARAAGNVRLVGRDDERVAPFLPLFESRAPRCERLDGERREWLFGSQGERVGSVVLLPLLDRGEYGLLAIGSHDAERFSPGMGTLYLERMAALVSRALQAYLE